MGPRPQAPATEPGTTGTVTRDGVGIGYAVYGGGSTTVLLMPTWTVVHSRIWKAQIGYLARHFRVVTFDGRGNGRSDRPGGGAAYTDEVCAADALAVLDATATARAVVVGLSWGLTWGLHLAAAHPDRVAGLLGIGGSSNVDVPRSRRDVIDWEGPTTSTEGWGKYNRQYWLDGGYGDFMEFFFGQMFGEPHSTKQVEDAVGWSRETSPQAVADATAGMHGFDGIATTPIEEVCARVSCPVLLDPRHRTT